MNITLSGVHVDVSDSLKAHAEQRLAEVKTYFEHVLDVQITLVAAPHHSHLHNVEVTVHVNGLSMHASGTGIDWYAGLDDAVAKIMRQLQKYKGRLSKHREQRAKHKEQLKNMLPIHVEDARVEDAELEDIAGNMFAEFAPSISKKDVSKISPMSVDEAVMQMDLLHKPAYLFLNAQSGQLNMVYREGENSIRWVAPKS